MNELSHRFFTTLFKTNNKSIIDYVMLPNEDEIDNLKSCHYFNYDSKCNFTRESDTAFNRFIWHLGNYLLSKKIEELGRALHFWQDLCTPVNQQLLGSCNAELRLTMHTVFEQELDKYVEKHSDINPKAVKISFKDLVEYVLIESKLIYKDVLDNPVSTNAVENAFRLGVFAMKNLKVDNLKAKSWEIMNKTVISVGEEGFMFPSCICKNIKFVGDRIFSRNRLKEYSFIGVLNRC